jgi:membrane-associated phospholipid phosphatase
VDAALLDAIRSSGPPAFTRFMWLVTLTGDTVVMTTLVLTAAALLLVLGRRREALVLVPLMILVPLGGDLLKSLTGRPRPPAAEALIAMPHQPSMPSGHALAALAFYGTLALFVIRAGTRSRWSTAAIVALFCAAGAAGFSRVYLGVHWPTDVLAGWALGLVVVYALAVLLARWDRVRPETGEALGAGRRRRPVALVVALGGAAVIAALIVESFRNPLL